MQSGNNDSGNKKLINGFTTGSAATAASKAAVTMLITRSKLDSISINTPCGEKYNPTLFDQEINDSYASCYVVKESGDDPDITSGIKIYSKVMYSNTPGVHITGGTGIGIVTRPGLDQQVGEYAINSVPRQMIIKEVTDVLDSYDIEEYGIDVEISVPEGVDIAKKTFNPHMGIEGGISIIGTTGIVKPMSTDALIETIKLDIKMQYHEGKDTCIIVPGNYGVTFLENYYNYQERDIVLCSNFVGDSIKFAADFGFKNILFCSHIGKMIKVSGGIMNTHSMYGDRRMELMRDAFTEACNLNTYNESITNEVKVVDVEEQILQCVSTTAALNILNEIDSKYGTDLVHKVSKIIVDKTLMHLRKACENRANINCILYENSYGELARTF